MKIERHVDVKRIAALFKKDILESYRAAYIVSAAAFAILLIVYLIAAFVGRSSGLDAGLSIMRMRGDYPLHESLYPVLLFFGGLIVTSLAFGEAHNKNKNHGWLMLPASNLEKLTARLLMTSLGYAAGSLAFYFFFSLIAAGVSSLFIGVNFPVFNPFNREILLNVAHYLVTHSIYLLGAIYFRKYHFLKTTLSFIGFGIAFAMLLAIFVRLVFWEYFTGFLPSEKLITLIDSVDNWDLVAERLNVEKAGRVFEIAGNVLYWAILAPVCWTIAYLRLRETEVKDGV